MDNSDGDTSRTDVRVGVALRLVDSGGRCSQAQRLRERLVAAGIPAERVQVVGRGLTPRGPRAGRWTTVDAASRVALPGLIVGALVGWILRLTGLVTSDVAPGWVVLAAALVGTVIGAIVGVLGRELVAGRRDSPMRGWAVRSAGGRGRSDRSAAERTGRRHDGGEPVPVKRTGRPALLVVLLLAVSSCSHDQDCGADHVVAGGTAQDRDDATFVMAAGADVVRVRTADLGDDLYRIATPDEAKVVPKVHLEQDTVTTTVADAAGSGPAVVTAELSAAVRWRIRLEGGAKEEIVDLTNGKATAIEFVAGTSLAEVSLPPPDGRVQVSLAGGASELKVHLTGTQPARVHVGGGASTVTVDDDRRTGVAAGTVLTSGDWTGSGERYEIELSAGVSRLSVTRTATG